MAHGDARDRKWRGNWRMELVASTLHTTSKLGVSSITTADAHTSAASSRLNWRPCRFKWTCPFRRKRKSGFCACAITFQTHSTDWIRGWMESRDCPKAVLRFYCGRPSSSHSLYRLSYSGSLKVHKEICNYAIKVREVPQDCCNAVRRILKNSIKWNINKRISFNLIQGRVFKKRNFVFSTTKMPPIFY